MSRGTKIAIGVGAAVIALIGLGVAFGNDDDGELAARLGESTTTAPSTSTSELTTTAPPTTAPPTTAAPSTAPPTTAAPAPPPPPALMPSVVCMNLQDAQDLIQTTGVFFSRSFDATGQDRSQIVDSNWIVVSQDPPPGTPIDEGSANLGAVKYGEPAPC